MQNIWSSKEQVKGLLIKNEIFLVAFKDTYKSYRSSFFLIKNRKNLVVL